MVRHFDFLLCHSRVLVENERTIHYPVTLQSEIRAQNIIDLTDNKLALELCPIPSDTLSALSRSEVSEIDG